MIWFVGTKIPSEIKKNSEPREKKYNNFYIRIMIIRTVEIDSEEHAKQFDDLVNKLPYVKKLKRQHLSVEDVVMPYGETINKEDLLTFLSEDDEDLHLISSDDLFKKYRH